MVDALIVGAGPGGLTAALYLARYHRSTLLVDAGDSRARYIPVSHNTPGFAHGVGGEQLLSELREQAAQYGAVAEHASVRAIARRGDGFVATLGAREVAAANVVLATGVVDTLPALPGIDAAIHAGLVRLCPVCDAYETAGRRVAVYGAPDAACTHACYMRTFSASVSALCDAGTAMPEQARRRLAAAGVQVLDTMIGLALGEGCVIATTADGKRHVFDTLYPFLGAAARSELASDLGACCEDDGQLRVDHHQQTTVPGLYAIGDVVGGLNQISVAVGHAARAATHIHQRLPFQPWPG